MARRCFITLADAHDAPARDHLDCTGRRLDARTDRTSVQVTARTIYRAPDYDTLVDAPILVGNPQVYEFRVGDV